MDLYPLNYAVDHPVGAGVIRIQPLAKAQVVAKQLGNQNLKRSAELIRRLR
jgi:hypothetical protein